MLLFFLQQLILVLTKITSKIATLISYVLTDCSQKVSQCYVIQLGISDHDLKYCIRKTSLFKLNKHNEIRSMKNYTKEKILDLLRKTDFPDYRTYTCLKEAYLDFFLKLNEVIDLLCPGSKRWIDSETISATLKRGKLFKIWKIYGLETDKDNFGLAKIALQKGIWKKKKFYFQEKIEKNAHDSKRLWKVLKSLGMKSGKVNQSKITLEKIWFEPTWTCEKYKYFQRMLLWVSCKASEKVAGAT